jgi:hypothetical protein
LEVGFDKAKINGFSEKVVKSLQTSSLKTFFCALTPMRAEG